jgi:hypothetical protein
LGDVDEFNKAVQAVVSTVRFDRDVNVSVFEATIRVIGGLLSAHLQALEKTPDYKVLLSRIFNYLLTHLGSIIEHVCGFS